MHMLSSCALAAANASDHARALRSRAHCLCQTPDLRYLPEQYKQGTDM